MNLAVVALVSTIGDLLDTEGWVGWGITSPEHWVSWKANVSKHRALGLVEIARRRRDLPGVLGPVRAGTAHGGCDGPHRPTCPCIAGCRGGRAGGEPDDLPAHPDPVLPPGDRARPRRWRTGSGSPGSTPTPTGGARATCPCPPMSGPPCWSRSAPPATPSSATAATCPPARRLPKPMPAPISWADADRADGLGGHRRPRRHLPAHRPPRRTPPGRVASPRPARRHPRTGPAPPRRARVTDSVARYLACDAQVIVIAYRNGKLLGINPSERTPNRRLRRYLEHRDGGCAHPLCEQKRWLHAHHIQHWEDNGPTEASNLSVPVPQTPPGPPPRRLHIHGDPEDGTLRFQDRFGRPIEPPQTGATPLPPPTTPPELTFRPPCGERLNPRDFGWN